MDNNIGFGLGISSEFCFPEKCNTDILLKYLNTFIFFHLGNHEPYIIYKCNLDIVKNENIL